MPATISLILDQHAEESSFLASLRDYAVQEPNYDLKHLGNLDNRIEAHLDGLRVSGLKGLDILLQQINPHTGGEVFAATVLAFQSNNTAVLSKLTEHLRTAPEAERFFAAALGWLDWRVVEPWIDRLLSSPEPLFRRIGLAACGMHRHDPGPTLLAGISHADPSVLARAVRTAGELRRRDLMPAIRTHRLHADPALRFWANWATAQMGDEEALQPLRLFAEQPGPYQIRALTVVLQWQEQEASIAWLRRLTQDATQRRLVVQATGLYGDPVAVPWLIQRMHELPLARVAGEAFTLITGADLALLDLELAISPDYDAGPNDDPNDPNVAMDDDENLPWPDPALVENWWQANRERFQSGTRYLLGTPLGEAQCMDVLRSGWQRQRIAAAYGLARYRPTQALFPTSAPVKRQRMLLNI